MKTLLDESLPNVLAEHLPRHEVATVEAQGWKGVKNGKLLELIEENRFEAFITPDERMRFEQTLERRPFAVLLLSTNHLPTLQRHYERIAEALNRAEKGRLTFVDCGIFKRARRPCKRN